MSNKPTLKRVMEGERVCRIGLTLDDKDICRLWLIDYELRLRGAVVTMGGIGGVGTNEEYRNRGYASRIMDDSVEYMRERPHDVGMLYGIQDFYERWNYAVCMSTHDVHVPTEWVNSVEARYRAVPYDRDAHAGAVRGMYAAIHSGRSCARVRSSHWDAFEHGTNWHIKPDPVVFLDGNDAPVAYVNMDTDNDNTRVAEVGWTTPDAFESIAAYLAERARTADHDEFSLCCPTDVPFVKYLKRFGFNSKETPRHSGGGMLRIIHLVPLFEKIAAAQSEQGIAAEGSIAFSTDIGDVTLTARDGKVTATPGVDASASHRVETPQHRLIQLITGYRDVEDLSRDAEVTIPNDANPLLNELFPQTTPFMWWSDRF